jgi:hypothetical protein
MYILQKLKNLNYLGFSSICSDLFGLPGTDFLIAGGYPITACTSYKWMILHHIKHPLIELCLCFIRLLHHILTFSIVVIHTDDGGELWGKMTFRKHLLEETQVIIEPTRSKNSGPSGKPK